MASLSHPLRLHRPTCMLPIRTVSSPLQPPRSRHQPITYQQARHESTARRHRKLLNVPPAEFMGGPPRPTGSSGRSRTAHRQLPTGDHIIFNPPPSAPNVYHTPLKFLPRDDPRRKLIEQHRQQQIALSPASASTTSIGSAAALHQQPESQALPPPVRTPYSKAYHITPGQMEEMRALRRSDEAKWTRTRLAEKFGCSRLFVGMVVQASEERVKEHETAKEMHFARFGKRRAAARTDRRKRKDMWKFEV